MGISEAAVMTAEQAAVAPGAQLDINDVRLAIGALSHSHRDLVGRVEAAQEALDDIGALMSRLAAFSSFLDDVETFATRIPELLRGLADDPMVGMFVGGPAAQLADSFEQHMRERGAARSNPPAIEQQH